MSLIQSTKAITFDLGGTLIEYEGKPWDQLEYDGMLLCYRFLTDRGFDLPSADKFADEFAGYHSEKWEEIRSTDREIMFDRRLDEFLQRYNIELHEATTELVDAFYAVVAEQLELRAGAVGLLEAVSRKGMKIGLISNTPFPSQWHKNEMESFGILRYFDYTVFSSDFGIRKPNSSIYRDCLQALGATTADSVHIGDRPIEDVWGAGRVGMTTVMVRRTDRVLPRNVNPDYIVDKLIDVVDL
jgi:HAD superfamily hydrolase (TIGR01509 family)